MTFRVETFHLQSAVNGVSEVSVCVVFYYHQAYIKGSFKLENLVVMLLKFLAKVSVGDATQMSRLCHVLRVTKARILRSVG
jgi:hypothetical protein